MTIVQHVRPRLAHRNTPALLEALDRDEFEGYASLFSVADGAGDIVAPGAFARSLKRRPPDRVRMLYQHFAHEPIGVWEAIAEDARGLYVRGRLNAEVARAQEVAALVAQGALNGLSIGFRTLRARRDVAAGTRTLLEVELWEISVVTFPLLAGSEVTAIGRKSDAAVRLSRAARAMRTSLQKNRRGLSSPAFAVEGDREAVEGDGRDTRAAGAGPLRHVDASRRRATSPAKAGEETT